MSTVYNECRCNNVDLSLRELREGITVVDGDDNQLGSSQVCM